MKRTAIAFLVGLGLGLLVTAVRVVVRARKGLPTVLGPTPASNGTAANGAGPAGNAGAPLDALVAFAERVRAAVAEGATAMRETEAELRSSVLHEPPAGAP